MEYKFAREKAHTFFKNAMPLFDLHWREVGHYQDILLNVDVDKYVQVEELGDLRCYTARDNKDELVGYAVFFVKHNIHYKDSLQASQDILFIHPDKRGFGSRFIKWCDEQLKLDGVQAVYHHVKQAHNFGPLLEKFGYELVDLIYARRLDK